jgi:carbonic anhydrase
MVNLIGSPDSLNAGGFLRYNGSLTNPPCSENVKWTVFGNTIDISEAQVSLHLNILTIKKILLLKKYINKF